MRSAATAKMVLASYCLHDYFAIFTPGGCHVPAQVAESMVAFPLANMDPSRNRSAHPAKVPVGFFRLTRRILLDVNSQRAIRFFFIPASIGEFMR